MGENLTELHYYSLLSILHLRYNSSQASLLVTVSRKYSTAGSGYCSTGAVWNRLWWRWWLNFCPGPGFSLPGELGQGLDHRGKVWHVVMIEPTILKNSVIAFTFWGFGHMAEASIFAGSLPTPCSLTTCPIYFTCFFSKDNFDGLSFSLAALNHCRTSSSCSSCI